jgi:hypothetical protein
MVEESVEKCSDGSKDPSERWTDLKVCPYRARFSTIWLMIVDLIGLRATSAGMPALHCSLERSLRTRTGHYTSFFKSQITSQKSLSTTDLVSLVYPQTACY